jgi:hypothetical protein
MKRGIWIWLCAAAVAAFGWVSAASAAGKPARELPDPTVAPQLFSAPGGVQDTSPGATEVDSPIDNQNPDGSPLGHCWAKDLLRSDGIWPYTRRLYLYTVWCGHAGVITYRASSARTNHDWACWNNPAPPQIARTYGGAGYGVVEVQAWVTVSCHSPAVWPTFNDTLMMRVQYYPWGGYATVAWD